MDTESKTLPDGKYSITFTMTVDELDEEIRILEELEKNLPDVEDEDEQDVNILGRRRYCCSCGTHPGDRHNIKASSSFSATLKCFRKCGAPFSKRRGRC